MGITPELAEICGIHAGDGYLRNDGKRRELDIRGNFEEVDYYDDHVINLFRRSFNINLKGKYFLYRRTYGFVIRDPSIVEFFHNLGFPYGTKTFTVSVPLSILNSNDSKIYQGFLRGLLDTDGHIGFRKYYGKYDPFKTSHHVYPVITIASSSLLLIDQVSYIVEKLGFTFNIYTYYSKKRKTNFYTLNLNGIENMEKWMLSIGSKNKSKFSRYLVWKKLGYCPTHLNFKQREDILNDKMTFI